MPDPPRDKVRAGDPFAWSSDDYNAMAASIEAIAGVTAAPPLFFAAGRMLSDATPRPFWAKLSGSSSPYSWTEQVRVGGAWVDGPRSGTASAVEVNNRSGLAGKLMRLWPCEPGVWCGQFIRRGTTYTIPSYPCGPCDVPLQDLHLSWTYTKAVGGTNTIAIVLTYTAGTPPTWISGLTFLGGFGHPPASASAPCTFATGETGHQFEVVCQSSQVQLNHIFLCNGGASTVHYGLPMANATFSCSPFSADWPLASMADSDVGMVLTT